jgi:class 3 adenylate cyclase/tetratricopeptide (TPR) repeat protein
MHADVKGYSRLMSENEVETVRTLTSHKELLLDYVNAHRGRIVDMAGDGFLVEFGSIVDALLCAVEFQKETGSRNQALPENRRLEFRIGINIGDVIQHGEQIFGDGVNIAARLESIADPGGICVSGEAYDQLKRKMELDFEFLGEKNVKNISEPIRAYRVIVDPQRTPPRAPEKLRVSTREKRYLIPLIIVSSLLIVVLAFFFLHRGGKQGQGKKQAVTAPSSVTSTVTTKDPQPPAQQSPTSSAKSYELFLEALGYSNLDSKQGNETAIRLLKEALETDPEFARALSELAAVYVANVRHQWTETPREFMEQAAQLSARAIRIDDSLSTPYSVLAFVNLQKRQYREALANAEKAISRSHGKAESLEIMGLVLTFSGRSQEAIPYLEKAIRLNPETPARSFAVLGHACLGAGNYDGAISAYKKALDKEPRSSALLSYLASAYVLEGRMTEAQATASELTRVAPNFSVENLTKRLPYKDPGETARIMDALHKVGLH